MRIVMSRACPRLRTCAVSRTILIAMLAALVAGVPLALAEPSAPSTEAFAAAIQAQVKELVPTPRQVVLTREKALAAAEAIDRDDDAPARQAIEAAASANRSPTWRAAPLNVLLQNMVRGNDADFITHVTQWVQREPDSALPYLVRAQAQTIHAWLVRGHKYTSATHPDHVAQFSSEISIAQTDIEKSIAIDGSIAYSYYLWLEILRGRGNTLAMDLAFHTAILKFPDYYPLYKIRLTTLEPKWGGTVAAMYRFVDAYAGTVDEASPRKFLYLDLYSSLLNVAWTSCQNVGSDQTRPCVAAAMGRLVTPELESRAAAALALRHKVDAFEYDTALRPILTTMIEQPGGQPFYGALLQLAANEAGSANQLTTDHADHNDYMLDSLTAQIWVNSRFYTNAETKFKQALLDLTWAQFPSEEASALAKSDIYDGMARLYRSSGQFDKMIAYHDAAKLLNADGDPQSRYLSCYGYDRLERFEDAKRVCGAEFDATGDVPSRFYRAQAEIGLGDFNSPTADYAAIADSEHDYQNSAIVALSFVLARQDKFRAVITALGDHPRIFQQEFAKEDDIAVAYNNRCYAYMKLGDYRKALDDCTASLAHGNIPDAFQKQQELVNLLKRKQSNL